MNSLKLMSSAAVTAMIAAAAPALAQVVPLLADVSIEGPIQGFEAPAAGETAPNGQPIVGVIKVMGATVKVPANAPIHSPTNDHLTWEQFTTGPFPGRGEPGFQGGTAIVTGDSAGGVIYATDVFSDLAENVVVGEATASVVDGPANRATVNNIALVPLDDPRMPAGRPINGFGFEVNPAQITAGSLVSVEGYFAGDKLNYHTLEADGAVLVKPTTAEVSVLRAQCRIRGGGRDELEVRGGTKVPANAAVRIQYLNAANAWVNVNPVVAPVVDNTVTPAQGLYRYNSSALRFPGAICPAQIRATFSTNVTVASEGFAPDAR